MPTLAQTLGTTTPISPLLRKAGRLGIQSVEDMITLAALRGCHHYSPIVPPAITPSASQNLTDEEITILLLVGENPYNPNAIRCAAQMARSPKINPAQLARLAVMENCERVLSHIARAGITHDPEGCAFWSEVLHGISPPPPRHEPNLPHWSRFVSMPGIQRGGIAPTRWLVPHP